MDPNATVMKVTTWVIASTAMVYSNGPVETSTRANTKRTKETATARCTGPMAAAIKVSGSVESSTGTEK